MRDEGMMFCSFDCKEPKNKILDLELRNGNVGFDFCGVCV